MEHSLTIRVSDDVFQELAREASAHGTPVESYAGEALAKRFAPRKNGDSSPSEAYQRLIARFGSVRSESALGLDNASIDADLARAYDQHGE